MLLPSFLLLCLASEPTWEDVRPIVARHCAACHRVDGEGPFRLDRASDLAARRTFAASVVRDGLMPPWLPGEGGLDLQGRGRIDDRERALLLTWLNAGAKHPADSESAEPHREPPLDGDVITLQLEPGFDIPSESEVTLHAHAHNVRTFALPLANDETLSVTAIRWETPLVNAVHSVAVSVDPSGQSEVADAMESPAGYHMSGDVGANPAGAMGVLGVGERSLVLPEGFAFTVPVASAVVTEVSYRPTGRDLPLAATLLLEVADPQDELRQLETFVIMKPWIKLAAGERRSEQAELEIPIDLDVVALTPRGDHYLRAMRLTATAPGREPRTLVSYPDWDMHWRSTHVLQEPLRLEAGTLLELELDVDNSDGNPRNLSFPAEDVTLGRFTGVDGVLFHAAPANADDESAYREWIGSLRR